MRALIFGGEGQLGRALQATAPDSVEVVALSRTQCDITDRDAVESAMRRGGQRPHLVVNAAAYTAVDRAESEPEAARRINVDGARIVAQAAKDENWNSAFVHISTDFVFDGAAGRSYRPDDATNPLGVYGLTKRDGEEEVFASNHMAVVIRTSWVYAATGHNFVRTMLRLMRERDEVRIVADQVGTPTHAKSLARAIWNEKVHCATGDVLHWTDAGVCSWYDFAVAIQEEALAVGLLDRTVAVVPIRTADFPTPARRPSYSVLDKTAIWALTGPARHWREELRLCLAEMKDQL